jgi:hypothetical protein
MDRSGLPNAIMKYQPGSPLKRLLDCYTETVAGHKRMVKMIIYSNRNNDERID